MQRLGAAGTTTEAIKQAESAYRKKVSKDTLFKLSVLCDMAELLHEEFDADNFTAMLSNVMNSAALSVDAGDVTFEWGRSHPFFEAIKGADRLTFSRIKNDRLRITFYVDRIWEDG